MVPWSRRRPLTCIRLPASSSAKACSVKESESGSGPRVAIPGTSDGEETTYAASRLRVPASVRSKPDSSEKRTRSAIGDLPGRRTLRDNASDHRSHPARARWKMRCVPSQSMSMNLPCRDTRSTGAPTRAWGGGLKVFRTEIEPSSTPVTANPSSRAARKSTRAWTSGSSGIGPAFQRDVDEPAEGITVRGPAHGHLHRPAADRAEVLVRDRQDVGENLLGRGQLADGQRPHDIGPDLGEVTVDRGVVLAVVADEQPSDVGEVAGQPVQGCLLVVAPGPEPAGRRGAPVGEQHRPQWEPVAA